MYLVNSNEVELCKTYCTKTGSFDMSSELCLLLKKNNVKPPFSYSEIAFRKTNLAETSAYKR